MKRTSRIKEMNKPALKEIFEELEFKTLGKRLLGKKLNQAEKPSRPLKESNSGHKTKQPHRRWISLAISLSRVQPATVEINIKEEDMPAAVDRNIHNTPTITAWYKPIKRSKTWLPFPVSEEICFDTNHEHRSQRRRTGGYGFSVKPGEGFYVTCPADQKETAR